MAARMTITIKVYACFTSLWLLEMITKLTYGELFDKPPQVFVFGRCMDIVVYIIFFWCQPFVCLVFTVRRVEVECSEIAYLFPLFITEDQEGLLSQEISSILCGMYS